MQALSRLWPGVIGSTTKKDEQQPNLLADWQTYQQGSDVEAGSGASGTAQDVGSGLLSLFRSGYSVVSDGISGKSGAFLDGSSMPSWEQLNYFFCFMAGGLVFLGMAVFIFLPVIILAPAKFALSFTIGCCLVLLAFASLKGWRRQAAQMFEKERLPYTAGYLGSVALTLYASLFKGSYLLSLLASGLQVVALSYYLTSQYGGTESLQWILSMFWTAVTRFIGLLFASK